MDTPDAATRDLLGLFADTDDEAVLVVDGAGLLRGASAATARLLGVAIAPGTRWESTGIDYRVVRALHAGHAGARRSIELGQRHLSVTSGPWAEGRLLHIRDESRLRQLERTRSDFVSNVSHDLRTPITAVRLLAETLNTGALEDARSARGFVERILVETTHMEQLVEELILLSIMEGGQRVPRADRVDPEQLVGEARRLEPLVTEAGLTLTTTVLPGTPPIRGDGQQLAQVVRNLAHNAIKFTPRGGRIEISARGVGESVELVCADTGVGIQPGDQERIFERFWKADSARDRRTEGQGAGLGLAIVRHAVEAHSGSIRVQSEPGRGARFVVMLPAVADS